MGLSAQGLIILGGSFNPAHIGHLRLAIEAREALGTAVEGLDFVPCAMPPHKSNHDFLPFALRVRLLRAALENLPPGLNFRINELEAARQGPSYTWDTLLAYRESRPKTRLFFLLGDQDYAMLPNWRKGLDLPELCSFLVVPRHGLSQESFISLTRSHWPEARETGLDIDFNACQESVGQALALSLPQGGKSYYLPLPRLDLSASRVRRLWLAGRSLCCLLPPEELNLLNSEFATVGDCWRNCI